MQISDRLRQELPQSVLSALNKLSTEQQASFEDEYKRRKKSTGKGLLLLLCLPGFHFYQLGFTFSRVLVSALFLATAGGLMAWWLLEFFLHRKRIQRHNESLAVDVLKDIKALYA
jgi:Flp pilus assembly protein TadB